MEAIRWQTLCYGHCNGLNDICNNFSVELLINRAPDKSVKELANQLQRFSHNLEIIISWKIFVEVLFFHFFLNSNIQ